MRRSHLALLVGFALGAFPTTARPFPVIVPDDDPHDGHRPLPSTDRGPLVAALPPESPSIPGRSDYPEPGPLPEADRARIAAAEAKRRRKAARR